MNCERCGWEMMDDEEGDVCCVCIRTLEIKALEQGCDISFVED